MSKPSGKLQLPTSRKNRSIRQLFPEDISSRKRKSWTLNSEAHLGYEADEENEDERCKRRKVYNEKSLYGRGNYTTYHSPSRSPSCRGVSKNTNNPEPGPCFSGSLPAYTPASPGYSPNGLTSPYSPGITGYTPASPSYGYSPTRSSSSSPSAASAYHWASYGSPRSPRYPASPTYSSSYSQDSTEAIELIDLTGDLTDDENA